MAHPFRRPHSSSTTTHCRRQHTSPDAPVEGLDGGVEEGRELCDAGVVHDNVNVPGRLQGLWDGMQVGEVGFDCDY